MIEFGALLLIEIVVKQVPLPSIGKHCGIMLLATSIGLDSDVRKSLFRQMLASSGQRCPLATVLSDARF